MDDKALKGVSGGLFLIGLGLIFLIPQIDFWPWILVVIGVTSLPAALSEGQGWAGWQSFFWMIGLAVLFYTGLIWPGILILVGISSLFAALTRDQDSSPFQSKKQAADDGDDDDDDWDDSDDDWSDE